MLIWYVSRCIANYNELKMWVWKFLLVAYQNIRDTIRVGKVVDYNKIDTFILTDSLWKGLAADVSFSLQLITNCNL